MYHKSELLVENIHRCGLTTHGFSNQAKCDPLIIDISMLTVSGSAVSRLDNLILAALVVLRFAVSGTK
jgi:hypothetical protein